MFVTTKNTRPFNVDTNPPGAGYLLSRASTLGLGWLRLLGFSWGLPNLHALFI